jgi:hypothetical protein
VLNPLLKQEGSGDYFLFGMSHFLLMMQRGQKFKIPAIKGINPKKNQGA